MEFILTIAENNPVALFVMSACIGMLIGVVIAMIKVSMPVKGCKIGMIVPSQKWPRK